MEKETRLDDDSSNKVVDESSYLLKNAESEKTKKKANIKMKVKSDEDKEEDMINRKEIETRSDDSSDRDEKESKSKYENGEIQLTDDREAQWIKQNIHTKVMVKSAKDNEEDIIKEVETNSFGEIEFIGAARKAKAKFVRMSDETPGEIVFELLTEQWKLADPRILISIIGGAKLFEMEENLKEFLVEGLRKITQSPYTWVITGGTNADITKLVGKSLQGVTKSLIGISTWGTITNTDSLYEQEQSLLGRTFRYKVADNLTEYRTFLDHNHPYHLLVDDASTGEYEKEIPLVYRLLKYVAYRKGKLVEAVALLLEGDINSLENVIKAVAGDEPIPILVVNGSGRAADVLSFAMQCSQDEFHRDLLDFIVRIFGFNNNAMMIHDKVIECMQYRDMISIVTLNKDEGIDVKILKAIMKCYDLTNEERLQYTVLSNRVDMAENLFLDTSIEWKKPWVVGSMVMALMLNRYKFVEYFIDQNINIHEMITHQLLEFLYGHRSTREQSIIKHCIGGYTSRPVQYPFFTLLNIEETTVYDIILFDEIFLLLNKVCENINWNILQEYESYVSTTRSQWDNTRYPYRDIFLWAVVNNMQEMAKVLWKLGDEQIAKAIVAAEINRKLAEKAEEKNLSDEIIQMHKKNQREFKELALKVLDACYRDNYKKSEILLTSELTQFPSHNCISLANQSCFQEFIVHKAVRQVLKDLWWGKCMYERHMIQMKNVRKQNTPEIKNEHKATDSRWTYRIGFGDGKHKNKEIHFDAPVYNFISSLVSYWIFLMLISYCAVLKKEDTTPNVIEIIVFVLVISYAVEEIYQVYVRRDPKLRKIQIHFQDFFNLVDVTAIILHFIAFALQLNSSSMEYGHLLYAIDAMLWIVRLLQYFYASKLLGTYVIMIGRMFIDMCYFISVLGVFILAYGVLSSAILRPETRIIHMIKNIAYFPYFNIYGELFADSDSSPGMTKFGTKVINDYAEPISWIFLGLFLLIANVLLLNLLIAVFGNTFAEVHDKADEIWPFKRYQLVTEYSLKFPFPPPFTAFLCIWKMILSSRNTISKDNTEISRRYSDLREEIGEFERKNVINALRVQNTELQKDSINEKQEELNGVMKTLQEHIANLNKTTTNMENYLTQMNPLPKNN